MSLMRYKVNRDRNGARNRGGGKLSEKRGEAGRGLVVSPKFPRVNYIEVICMKT